MVIKRRFQVIKGDQIIFRLTASQNYSNILFHIFAIFDDKFGLDSDN